MTERYFVVVIYDDGADARRVIQSKGETIGQAVELALSIANDGIDPEDQCPAEEATVEHVFEGKIGHDLLDSPRNLRDLVESAE